MQAGVHQDTVGMLAGALKLRTYAHWQLSCWHQGLQWWREAALQRWHGADHIAWMPIPRWCVTLGCHQCKHCPSQPALPKLHFAPQATTLNAACLRRWQLGMHRHLVANGLAYVMFICAAVAAEPTSGLDSEIAVQIMQLLQGLAHQGRTVVLTIHQPNSRITALFDDFILLAQGRTMYSGLFQLDLYQAVACALATRGTVCVALRDYCDQICNSSKRHISQHRSCTLLEHGV